LYTKFLSVYHIYANLPSYLIIEAQTSASVAKPIVFLHSYGQAHNQGRGKVDNFLAKIFENILKAPKTFYLSSTRTSCNHFSPSKNIGWLQPWFLYVNIRIFKRKRL